MIEGTRTIRTTVASTRIATARPRPNTSRTCTGSPMTKDPKTQIMMAAAALMQGARAVGAYALTFSRSARFVEPALVNGPRQVAVNEMLIRPTEQER
jgi:hypothetical protein